MVVEAVHDGSRANSSRPLKLLIKRLILSNSSNFANLVESEAAHLIRRSFNVGDLYAAKLAPMCEQ